MYCAEDIIDLDDTYRLRVEQDQWAENPLDDWGGCEILTIDDYRMWMGWEAPDDQVAYASREFHKEVRRGKWTTEQRDRAISLALHLAGDTREFAVYEWRGYSKSDWDTNLVLWDKDEGANQSEEWGAWRRGDVYTVILEQSKIYLAEDDPDDVFEDWVEVDNIGGCYLDEGYTAEDVAKEHFDNYPREGEE